jgi:elongation factor P
MIYSASDLRKGLKIEIDNEPYIVTEFDFCKPGKGQALYRCKLKHMVNGNTMDRTFRSVDKIDKPDLEERELVYSYADGDNFVFMDPESYEQVLVPAGVVGDRKYFLIEDEECEVLFYRGRPLDLTTATFIELRIQSTEPGVRGDTATNVTKPAVLENGYELNVPLFLNEGDLIRVDTRTGAYCERVAKA